jgi:hypothetical protein
MPTKFKVKRSTVSGVTPTTGDIDTGELAINLPDRKLFTSNGSAVYELGSNQTNLSVSANLTVGATGDLVLTSGAGFYANGGLGTAGFVLHSNATSVYWAADDQGVTSVATGNGLTGGTITSTGTVSVLANSGIVANTTGVYVNANTGLVANATGVYVNATYIGTLSANNTTYLNGQLASYYTNATNITTGTLPWVQAPTGTVNTSGAFTFSSIQTFNANVVIGSGGELVFNTAAGIYANGSLGTAGQVLTSNGTTVYWATAAGGSVNTAAQYVWSNTQTFQANILMGNTTVNTQISNSTILLSNSTTTTTVSLSDIRIGNSTVNAIANASTIIFNAPAGAFTGIYKPSANGSRLEFLYAGSNNASNPFWNGYQFTAPGTFANSSAGSNFPRTSHFYSFTSTSNPSDLYYNIQAGNDGNIGTGIKIYSTSTSGTQGGVDIAANGNVGVGTTTPIAKIQSSADIASPFFIAPTTIPANYTIPTNYNAMTPGPVAVDSGVIVTVPSGSTWTIV